MTDSTATAAGQAEFALALLDPLHPGPPGLKAWNGSDPAVRLAVHRNNVVSSLIDALADNFPVLRQLVGEDFFRAMAGVFVRQWPPRSPILAHYGQDFPAFIAQFAPAAGLPYLADMARLEMARVQAYHAADVDAAGAEALGEALSVGDRVGELGLVVHPSVGTIASPYAVVSLWAAHQTEGEPELDTIDLDLPEAAWVLRPGLEVLVVAVAAASAAGMGALVAALRRGAGLAEAAAQARAADADFDLAAGLSLLVRHGGLCAIHLPSNHLG